MRYRPFGSRTDVLVSILGFAFQESLGNLAAGMMIGINEPFKVGDYVQAGGIEQFLRIT